MQSLRSSVEALILEHGKAAVIEALDIVKTQAASSLQRADTVTQIAEIDRQVKELNKRKSALEASILIEATEVMENSKLRTLQFYGDDQTRVEVQEADTLETVSDSQSRAIFKKVFKEYFSETTKVDMVPKLKKILIPILKGQYLERSVESIVNELNVSEVVRALLIKKLTGDYKKDINLLVTTADLEEETAAVYAYYVKDTFAYKRFLSLCAALDIAADTSEYVDFVEKLKSNYIVSSSVKTTLEYPGK